MSAIKIKDRIRDALRNGPMDYRDLAMTVFPVDQYPNAFRYQPNGGPPGCYMALSRAISTMRPEVVIEYKGMIRTVRLNRIGA